MKKNSILIILFAMFLFACNQSQTSKNTDMGNNNEIEKKIKALIAQMTLDEKIGQMCQISKTKITDELKEKIKAGEIGSFLNVEDDASKKEFQRVAVEESRLGIPLIYGRDIIHGYRTVFPIPLGLAATWEPEVLKTGAAVAAKEAAADGLHWTFAPMIDITNDPRWGRIAECCGEDPYLASLYAEALVKGFQGDDISANDKIAACAKHFAGYGASEAGKDYNTTWIPRTQMRNVYLRPFEAAKNAGVATFMCGFNDINGVPASGNEFLLRKVLRQEWGYDGMVVSDWASMTEMIKHGFCADEKEVALKSINVGIDMEMVSRAYIENIPQLIKEGKVSENLIDEAVANILRLKFRLGLFDNPYREVDKSKLLTEENLQAAKDAAIKSMVLIKNDNQVLPVKKTISKVAVIGPLADSPRDQLGCWVFDGKDDEVITPHKAFKDVLGEDRVLFAKGLEKSRTATKEGFPQAIKAAKAADIIFYFAGEEELLSGEARCRAFLDLPGLQSELLAELKATGKPVVMVIMAGRPLTFDKEVEMADALIYAWHPGTMGGPAIVDLVFGAAMPSGRLPVTFPRTVGQIPIYYNYKNTGRPGPREGLDIEMGNPINPKGYNSKYLDVPITPAYPFGYGLTYSEIEYSDLNLSAQKVKFDEPLKISATISNKGQYEATEVVQLYVRDVAARLTRPVKELKRFERVTLKPGESKTVEFEISSKDLAFWDNDDKYAADAGLFYIFVSKNAEENGLKSEFELIK